MNTPFNMGLIGMGGALLRPGSTLGDGFLGFQHGLVQGQRNDHLLREDRRQDALFGLQAQKHQAELDAAARKQRLLGDIANDVRPLGAPVPVQHGIDVTSELRALMHGRKGGELGSGTYGIDPSSDTLTRMAQRQSAPSARSGPQSGPQWSPQLALKMLMAGFSPADISTVAGAGDLGRSKVARMVEFAGPDGTPMIAQVDDYGRMVGQAMPKPVELGLEDFGATKRPWNKYTGTTQGPTFEKTLSPSDAQQAKDAAAGRAVTIRGQDLTDARGRDQLDLQRQLLGSGKAPAGYRIGKDGLSLEFIPGGPADPSLKPGTEDQNKAAGYAIRMEDALKTLEGITAKNPNAATPNVAANALRGMGADAAANLVTSSDRQRIEAAQLDALDAALALATGAAYTREQLQNLSRSYFPQTGDSRETIADKKARLEKVIETARIRAGHQASKIDRVGSAASGRSGLQPSDSLPSPSEVPVGVIVTDSQTGRRMRNDGRNWVDLP